MSSLTKTTPKTSRKTRIVTLSLSSNALAQFPHLSSTRKPSALTAITPKTEPTPSIAPPELSADKSSESTSTPAATTTADTPDPNSLAPPPKVDGRRKRGGGAVAGRKRAPPIIDPHAPLRERGRPGPKKKPRLPDGSIDRSGDGSKSTTAPIPAHKLGPKANTGAINAGLRALDRTGKPCRRWEKKGLQLKSFTGMTWNMAMWKAPTRSAGQNGDGEMKSDSSSDVKPPDSSAVQSERSNGGDQAGDITMGNGIASSPAPIAAA